MNDYEENEDSIDNIDQNERTSEGINMASLMNNTNNRYRSNEPT